MKKFVSIAIALVMVLSLTVCAFADDEVLLTEDTMFWSNGNWADYTLDSFTMTELLEALQTEGACLVVTRDTETHLVYDDGVWEKFMILDSWWSGTDATTGNGWVVLGTGGTSSEDEPDGGIIDCISDDGVTIVWDGATVAQALIDGGFNSEGGVTMIINSSNDGAYKVSNVSVVVYETAVAEEETTDDASAEETAEAAEETTESTETSSSTASSPDTGVALALVPMAIAGIAVVSSKRR